MFSLWDEDRTVMNGYRYPTTWTFELDERSTHMSLVSPGPAQAPIMATPASIRAVLAGFTKSESTPAEVRGMLEVSDYLMETSVIHYEFAALAVEKGLQALELMVRFAVGEVDRASKAGMKTLVEQAARRFDLRPELEDFLSKMVRLRNTWVGHPRNAAAFSLVSAVGFLGHMHSAIAELADLPPGGLAPD